MSLPARKLGRYCASSLIDIISFMLYNKKHYTQGGYVETPGVSQDDLLDVMELTNKLQDNIYAVLEDTVLYLSMPALIAATIKCMLHQCESVDQAKFYRDLFVTLFEEAFKDKRLK